MEKENRKYIAIISFLKKFIRVFFNLFFNVYILKVVNNDLIQYKKEHILTYNIYMTIGQIISYILVYVLYNYFYDINILSVAVSVLMFFLIISAIYLNKSIRCIKENSKI